MRIRLEGYKEMKLWIDHKSIINTIYLLFKYYASSQD